MINEQIDLYKEFGSPRGKATGGYLTTYVRSASHEIKPKLRPAMIVLPGGGYEFISDREGEPVALAFVSSGFAAFVLTYSINNAYPVPLNEAIMAVSYVRSHAKEFGVDPNKICAVGFSAGGHLAGMLATSTAAERESVLGKANEKNGKIAAVVMSYPVVTMGIRTHGGTRRVISDDGKIPYDKLSVDVRAAKDSAPAFIWHTYEDDIVPVENSLLLASAYKKVGVPFSLHIFEKGWHGLSVCNAEVNDGTPSDLALLHVGKWVELAVDWLSARGCAPAVWECGIRNAEQPWAVSVVCGLLRKYVTHTRINAIPRTHTCHFDRSAA